MTFINLISSVCGGFIVFVPCKSWDVLSVQRLLHRKLFKSSISNAFLCGSCQSARCNHRPSWAAWHLCHEDNVLNATFVDWNKLRRGRLVLLCDLMMPYCPQSVGNQHLAPTQTDRWRIISMFKPLPPSGSCATLEFTVNGKHLLHFYPTLYSDQ